jgi:hypothetical protein
LAELVCVDPKKISEVWPHVLHFVKAAMKRGDMGTFADLQRDVLSGGALLWLVWRKPVLESAVVTQIILTERSKVCMIQACGGSMVLRRLDLLAKIEDYAKQQGCHCVRILGRRGWARVLPNYHETKIVLERPL